MDNETLIEVAAEWVWYHRPMWRAAFKGVPDPLSSEARLYLDLAESPEEARILQMGTRYQMAGLRSLSEQLAVAAEERGVDSSALWNLIGSLSTPCEAWDAAWVIVKRLETIAGIDMPDAKDDKKPDAATGDTLEESPEVESKRGRKPDPEVASRRRGIKALKDKNPNAIAAELADLYNADHSDDDAIDALTVRNDLKELAKRARNRPVIIRP